MTAERFRTKEEVKDLLNQIQDRLEELEIDYKRRRESLFDRAEEIKREEINR